MVIRTNFTQFDGFVQYINFCQTAVRIRAKSVPPQGKLGYNVCRFTAILENTVCNNLFGNKNGWSAIGK